MKLKFLGLLAALAALPLVAHASLQLSWSIQGSAPVVCNTGPDDGPVICGLILSSGVSISGFTGDSNSPGGPLDSEQFGSTLHIINASSFTRSVQLWISAQNFTFPTITPMTPSIDYSSEVALTSTLGAGSVDLTSCIDETNGLAPPTSPFCPLATPSLTNVTQMFSGASSHNNTVMENLTAITTPFSLSQVITFSLNAHSELNVNTSQILTPVPEPANAMLLGTALIALTAGLRGRRRRKIKL